MSVIVFILIGLIAGWIAGEITRGHGFGLLGNILIGIVGAFIGGFILRLFGVATGGFIGSLITAIIGAVVLLWIVNLFRPTARV